MPGAPGLASSLQTFPRAPLRSPPSASSFKSPEPKHQFYPTSGSGTPTHLVADPKPRGHSCFFAPHTSAYVGGDKGFKAILDLTTVFPPWPEPPPGLTCNSWAGLLPPACLYSWFSAWLEQLCRQDPWCGFPWVLPARAVSALLPGYTVTQRDGS